MLVVGMKRLCRVGLAAVLATALCVLTLVDMPLQLPESQTDSPPTSGIEPPGTRSIVAYSWARRLALDYRPSHECTYNGSISESSTNKLNIVHESWTETISNNLFLYSGYLDIRVTGYPSVRVIGVKREPMTSGILFCTIWQKDHDGIHSYSMEAIISDIWLDEWTTTSIGYTGILITCPLPDHASHPSHVYIGTTSCYKNPSHSLIVKQPLNIQNKIDFTLCVKGLDFDKDISQKIIAFIELSRILGAGMIYIYVFNIHNNVKKVLNYYEKTNIIKWFNINLPGNLPNDKINRRKLFNKNIWIKRRMELIPYNHCFYDNIYQSNYIIPIDIDEMIIPIGTINWSQLIINEKKKLGKSFNDYASYAVRNVFFFPELKKTTNNNNNSSSNNNNNNNNKFKSDDDVAIVADNNNNNNNDNSIDEEKNDDDDDNIEYLNYLEILRTSIVSPEGDSVKSFISTKRTLTVHNHYALMTLNPSTRRAHHFDPGDVLKHHYRKCDGEHFDCNLMMNDVTIDESILRYAEILKTRVKNALFNIML
ncbi:hypothetical protein HCN44_000863 [Aphidius gifuensis]|uniref:Glycosyltransferase family 92 protein n=1 Tax=Aphidius gifuensis TaxID=684658 RepID=A0A834XUT3_APHGI|nr:actin-related protein 8-like [Aphidius gifuensis]KAF7992017.1 hypothetical protein HCN44_000863 [Aphidius gifuensis]